MGRVQRRRAARRPGSLAKGIAASGRQPPCPLRPRACGRVRDRKDSVAPLDETYTLLLAPGVEPAPDAIAELQTVLDADPTVGLVGARLLGPDGLLVQAGGIVSSDGSVWSYGHGRAADDPRYLHRREVDWVSS